jgi:hypothetical protein
MISNPSCRTRLHEYREKYNAGNDHTFSGRTGKPGAVGVAGGCRRLPRAGISAYLTRPVKQSSLLDAIAIAAFDVGLGLEMLGKDKELGGAEAVFASLADEVERLGKALEVFSVRGDL